ncbi:hypothetical protein N1851_028349 [Merluccius polli]|uniref:Reverse transcriptase n=1 Tax=Merluccius polli TaxID=89951 RepID=A0AA47NSI1_MERPO|nr:hypothetical protein N1851_028349 [Merluccius polli]
MFALLGQLLHAEQTSQPAIVYSRQELLELAPSAKVAGTRHNIPAELLRKRCRGTRAGIKRNRRRSEKAWRRTFRPALPSIIMGNVRSLNNKFEELEALVRSQKVYRESSLLCFSETWLKDSVPDSITSIYGFRTIRADRDTTATGKRKGGGLAVFINNKWCNPRHVTIKEHKDIELLAYVDCTTREDKTLDLFYANVKNAYNCSALPPLGRSDHCLVHLSPTYTPAVKRMPVTTKTVKCWSDKSIESLQCCLETTDWNVFCESFSEDIDGLTDCLTDYINFCTDVNIPSREIRCYPNNKPWVTSNLKALLNQKKEAFRMGDRITAKEIQRELKVKIKEGKQAYSHKLEQQLQSEGVKQVWSGMRKITGLERKGGSLPDGDRDVADDLNLFFNRFDSPAPSCLVPRTNIPPTPPPPAAPLTVHPFHVRKDLDRLKQGKAAGPDGISPRLLKSCSTQLCEIFAYVFNLSLQLLLLRGVPLYAAGKA